MTTLFYAFANACAAAIAFIIFNESDNTTAPVVSREQFRTNLLFAVKNSKPQQTAYRKRKRI